MTIQRLFRNSRRSSGASISVALLGDSITSSCRRPSGDWFNRADPRCLYRVVANAGQGGSTTREMFDRLGTVLQARPDLCVVQGGGNDLAIGRAANDVIADLGYIYHGLREAGVTPIATTVLPHGDTPANRLRDVSLVNRYLVDRDDLWVCDWTTELVDESGWLALRYANDRTHPNTEAVAIMGACLYRTLKEHNHDSHGDYES